MFLAAASTPSPSDLSDREWAILAPLLPPPKPGGRPRSVDLRRILIGLFHILRSGCQWHLLPRESGPWPTVYAYFRAWRRDGTWERHHHTLYERVRLQSARKPTPSAAILDSQSVKATERGGPHGDDGAKKLSGRKRHLLVDTLGLVLTVLVHPADFPDRVGARWLLGHLQPAATTSPVWNGSGQTLGTSGRCKPGSGRPSAGACRSSSDPADVDSGCAPTRSHHCGQQGSRCYPVAGWWKEPSHTTYNPLLTSTSGSPIVGRSGLHNLLTVMHQLQGVQQDGVCGPQEGGASCPSCPSSPRDQTLNPISRPVLPPPPGTRRTPMHCRWEQLPPATRQQLLRLLGCLVERQLSQAATQVPASREEAGHDLSC